MTKQETVADVELLPCPFCGSAAKRIDFGPGDGDNFGGSCISCLKCQASTAVVFGYKETLYSSWNERPAISASRASVGEVDGETVAAPESLLRKATTSLPEGCYCTPGHCGAPRIMGRQMPCRDPDKAAGKDCGVPTPPPQPKDRMSMGVESFPRPATDSEAQRARAFRDEVCTVHATPADRWLAYHAHLAGQIAGATQPKEVEVVAWMTTHGKYSEAFRRKRDAEAFIKSEGPQSLLGDGGEWLISPLYAHPPASQAVPDEKALMQILHDPGNQPSQYGTVPISLLSKFGVLAPKFPDDGAGGDDSYNRGWNDYRIAMLSAAHPASQTVGGKGVSTPGAYRAELHQSGCYDEYCRGCIKEACQQCIETQPYRKDGETPAQRIQREINDNCGLLRMLADEKRKTEKLAVGDKDGERYRWLRTEPEYADDEELKVDERPAVSVWTHDPFDINVLYGDELDAAIDAAMLNGERGK